MRQAGRYLPEYRKLRERRSILELCASPELAAAAAMTAVNALPGLDAAIVFSDILQILIPMGIDVGFVSGEGPRIANPARTSADVAALKPVDPGSDLPGPIGAISILAKDLQSRMPVIGFAGAPFTLATYLIEGGPSRDYARTKTLMASEPETWNALMSKLAAAVRAHLEAQAAAGAAIVQLFDSWVGALGVDDYREFVLPHSRSVLRGLKVPAIHFGVGAGSLLEAMREAGGDVIGLDWRVDLADARRRLGDGVAVQGNLDPTALLLPRPELERRIDAVLDRAAGKPGHIFNLGHGVLPETPVENVAATIERVHARSIVNRS
ncbi:MAG TPA: uroporphyrinogen decarboxylase, partial [Candidatus Eisenbacteria bacterium]|nr:uroporphyrinogen decarboxylase [Candidatus Eisenbacteria bacterium]